ncbi:hypothetical protein MSAN_02377800 [Mycena sanguinolenta]|uniref:Uncharacterized protein n=1 Tax=Mycena sanguinolenta TaxID=230812 RepID=A0A8H7CEJ1_9AGAR|nr:hypothetical protein MSAN_02377800 [Mycena sanguinolenta]
MDPQADPDTEFIVDSTSEHTESALYSSALFPQAGGLKSNAKLKSTRFSPSFLGARVTEIQPSGTARTQIRKYLETMRRQMADQRSVTNYNYYITGGFGGSGGEGQGRGGDGGVGHGPTVYFGQPQAQEPSEFQKIRLGDVRLIKEVHLSRRSGIVDRQSRAVGVRRIYHAEIRRDPGTVTVAMYQGDGAEEEAANYLSDVLREPSMDYDDLQVWIRSATGELRLDLAQRGSETSFRFDRWWEVDVLRLDNVSLDAPDSEDIIISSLSEDQYHELFSAEHPIGLGVFRLDSPHGTCVRITESLQILPEAEPHWDDYGAPGELLPNSWIQYDSHQTPELQFRLSSASSEIRKAWLAQANRIFTELHEVDHVEDYVCVDQVQFNLRIDNKCHIDHDPVGYLFVCPAQDFRANIEPQMHLYQWPACPAYWSLDPSGADRLSTEDAKNLGFPAIHIETIMVGRSWDHSVYKGLRQFHEGKGFFNSDSGEVARQLGYPTLVLSDVNTGTPFPAHDAGESWDCEEDDHALCREFDHYL